MEGQVNGDSAYKAIAKHNLLIKIKKEKMNDIGFKLKPAKLIVADRQCQLTSNSIFLGVLVFFSKLHHPPRALRTPPSPTVVGERIFIYTRLCNRMGQQLIKQPCLFHVVNIHGKRLHLVIKQFR